MLRIVRTGDRYRREHVDLCETRKEARYLLGEYRLADPTGHYEVIKYRKRRGE
jgi:hypothetical protein